MKLKRKAPPSPVTEQAAPKKTRTRTKKEPVAKEPVFNPIPGLEKPEVNPKNYPGDFKSTSPEFVVTFDAAAFRYVWEMLESRAHRDYAKYSSISTVEAACKNSVNGFRRSYANTLGIESKTVKKKILRKKAS